MLQGWVVIAVALGYIGLLFLVASYGDRARRFGRHSRARLWIYPLSMAVFAVLFGSRHIDATEHQDGLILAVATESIVKLVSFLAVGIFVTFWMFDGPMALFGKAMQFLPAASVLTREPPADTLIAATLLSFVAILLLPRQFHVAVVENNDEREIKR